MKFSSSDFLLIRWNLAAVFASILLSGIVLYSSDQFAAHNQTELRTAQRKLSDARSRLAAAHMDQENMAAYSTGYVQLEEQNIIGDEKRLDWIEGLEKLRQQNLVIDFSYNIAPQKVYAPQPSIDSGNFNINYSEMKLHFDLLHEGQLLNFFAALRGQIKGHYQLEGCKMQRIEAAESDTMAVHVKAECSGGWITLKNRNAPK